MHGHQNTWRSVELHDRSDNYLDIPRYDEKALPVAS